ncbi:hypothetical protein [Modicisalibacter luteus]|uniref:Uncharacterized protein n=1 Tax=Modicisalibacter luteus TaxID=453962 RepID=A0ABV7M6M2_9GAMM|nr:hypothetical protein [Halomonas lutea]GHB07932.1 hypothetical protein GCM10007159_32460 [Halomonas lutea]
MAEGFTIDGLTYEVGFSGDTINFAIVGGANPVYDSDPYDPFDSPDDWSIEPRVTADIGVTRYPLRVYRQVLLRVHDWLGRTRPKIFSFSARSDRRYWIYERVARHLAERFDYDLQIIGGKYLFFKLKPGAASQDVPPAATDRRATA